MKHTLQVLVENKFGVLARVASLFSARGYNIDSLAVGETHDPTISCMTIVVDAEDERILEQIKKQLNKLIDVITVIDFTRKEYIDRELILLKINKREDTVGLIDKLISDYSLKVLDNKEDSCIIEICGDSHLVEKVLQEAKKIGIKELIRSGKLAISN
ncbi:MAG: acetolactate synthase small subunit [Candidatus Omnitrophica bacterium]|nr:acetolactate synthase small subunit [Candidatus Omnitrophota bacterium]